MELLGLSRHRPPAAFIWSDVGPNVAALATLAGARGDARDVAGWLTCCAWGKGHGGNSGYGGIGGYAGPREESGVKWLSLEGLGEQVSGPRAPEVAAIIRTWKDEEPRALWERLKAAGWPSLMPPKGMRWGQPILGRWLGPCEVGEVAGWLACSDLSAKKQPEAGYGAEYERFVAGTRFAPPSMERVAGLVEALPKWPRVACYQGTATRLVEQLPERLDRVVAYLDPPYSGTTGYKFGNCPREEVIRLALDLHRRGAAVAISEAVRLDRELGAGWMAVQIDGERRGQKRTFSVQQSEWVTMNRAPVKIPGQQQGLFGGAG